MTKKNIVIQWTSENAKTQIKFEDLTPYIKKLFEFLFWKFYSVFLSIVCLHGYIAIC